MKRIANRFTVILDANVLYPFLVRDVLLTLAESGMYRARWSAAITVEWRENLLAKRPDKKAAIDRTISLMQDAFPEALIEGFEPLIEALNLPDPDDRHVLAAAIRAGADHIITNNIKDFPIDALASYGIEAKTPDDFIVDNIDLFQSDAIAALRAMRARYDNPPVSKADFLLALIRAGLPGTAAALKPHIESL
jgi:predicted nucleic acid-binding protein